MLQLRPNCEYCDKDLPPNAIDARVCSYECTRRTRGVHHDGARGRAGGAVSPRRIQPSVRRCRAGSYRAQRQQRQERQAGE